MDKALQTVSWSLVQAFLAVAQSGSLSKAARQLGQSQPTLGRQIKQIEQQLGVSLFARQPRGLNLTETGAALLPAAQRMAEAMRELSLIAAGREDALHGTVRVTCSEAVAHYLMPEIIATIRLAEPQISIELAPTDSTENLLFREADIAVRMYRSEQLDVITRHIGDLRIGVYAAHSYLDRHGKPATLEDLVKHDFVGYDKNEMILRGMHQIGWDVSRDFFAVRCDNQATYWELVRAGCGIGFGQCVVADDDPRIQKLDLGIDIPSIPVWLAAHEGLRQTPRIRRVWSMLETHLRPFVS